MIPDADILLWYNELSQNMFKQITLLKERNENLAAQRDLLLPRLMSGKLEVQIDEDTEIASQKI